MKKPKKKKKYCWVVTHEDGWISSRTFNSRAKAKEFLKNKFDEDDLIHEEANFKRLEIDS